MFVVFTFVHRKLDLWRRYRDDHVDWLRRQVDAGAVAASGPFTDNPADQLSAMIVVRAESPEAARAVLDSDPFVQHGITEDLVTRIWNPLFGAFAGEAQQPGEGPDSG